MKALEYKRRTRRRFAFMIRKEVIALHCTRESNYVDYLIPKLLGTLEFDDLRTVRDAYGQQRIKGALRLHRLSGRALEE